MFLSVTFDRCWCECLNNKYSIRNALNSKWTIKVLNFLKYVPLLTDIFAHVFMGLQRRHFFNFTQPDGGHANITHGLFAYVLRITWNHWYPKKLELFDCFCTSWKRPLRRVRHWYHEGAILLSRVKNRFTLGHDSAPHTRTAFKCTHTHSLGFAIK